MKFRCGINIEIVIEVSTKAEAETALTEMFNKAVMAIPTHPGIGLVDCKSSMSEDC